MITLFDLSAAHRALPLGTGNKTERLFGYFTWHADDSPPVNPIGDLFKTQVWALARHLGVPDVIVSKPASADLIKGQTDEGDFGISYPRADAILHWILLGYRAPEIAALGLHRGGDRPGPDAARLDPLEAPAPHRRDAERDGDRGVLSEAGGLLERDGERRGERGESLPSSRLVSVYCPVTPSRTSMTLPNPAPCPTPSARSPPSSCRTCRTCCGDLFGGELMALVDQAAAVAAIRHAGGPAVTASIDRVDFRERIPVGALVTCEASVDFVGNTSMDISVEVYAEQVSTGERRHTHTRTWSSWRSTSRGSRSGCPRLVAGDRRGAGALRAGGGAPAAASGRT